MEVVFISIFSAIIIFITVFFMIKVLTIAYNREEITLQKYRLVVTTSIVIGVAIASVLPFGYQTLFDTFIQPII